MLLSYLSPSVLIASAGIVQIFAYLLINQTYLRLVMLVSTSLYISYYFTVSDTPLWGAIWVSSLTLSAILLGLAGLYARNAIWAIPKEHADIYPLFDTLLPGDFRHVVRAAKRRVLTEHIIVTNQGAAPDHMYFIIAGTFQVDKSGAAFDVPGPTFAGEVAYLMDAPSAATTTLPAGTEVLEWTLADLRRRSARSPRLKLALEAVIARDMARKVSFAIAPYARQA